MIKYAPLLKTMWSNPIICFKRIRLVGHGCLTVKNWWGLLTGDDGVGIMKIVTKGNGKDVLWRLYTLRFTFTVKIE